MRRPTTYAPSLPVLLAGLLAIGLAIVGLVALVAAATG
jgi:hypothetical protein